VSYRLLDDGRDDRRPLVGDSPGREHGGHRELRDRDGPCDPMTGASTETITLFCLVPIAVYLVSGEYTPRIPQVNRNLHPYQGFPRCLHN
jgi:hypothetical protein